jgi:hypothetical protein
MSSNALVATLLAMAGQRNVITVPRAFVKFTGSIEAAMMLNQLLYWKPRAHGETIYKTDPEWMDELCITRYAVRKARDCLVSLGVVTVEVHHVRGAPAVHYHIDFDALTERWESWLLAHDVKFENELDSSPSKVRKRTLPHESSSKTDSVKFENGQYINRMQRIHAENTSSSPERAQNGGDGDDFYRELRRRGVGQKKARAIADKGLDMSQTLALIDNRLNPSDPHSLGRLLNDITEGVVEKHKVAPAPLHVTRPNTVDNPIPVSAILRMRLNNGSS